MGPFQQMLCKVIRAEGQARSARTVEIFGWIVAAEAAGLLFAPHFAACSYICRRLANKPPTTYVGWGY